MKPTSKVSNGNSNMHMALKQTFETRGNGIPSLLTGGKICDYPHTCGGSECKESACNAGHPGSIPGLGRSPAEGNGNPFQYFSLESPWTEEHGGPQYRVLQSRTRLSD